MLLFFLSRKLFNIARPPDPFNNNNNVIKTKPNQTKPNQTPATNKYTVLCKNNSAKIKLTKCY